MDVRQHRHRPGRRRVRRPAPSPASGTRCGAGCSATSLPTEVSITYPADGQTPHPGVGVGRARTARLAPGRGGARTRIAASLTYSLPYRVPAQPPVATTQLPAGAMMLTERDSGDAGPDHGGVPAGRPLRRRRRRAHHRHPAGGRPPAVHLVPGRGHREPDRRRWRAVTPYSWTFRTGADARGSRCSGDGYNLYDHQAFVREVYRDLFGRPVDTGSLAFWSNGIENGSLTRSQFATIAVDSVDHRRNLVDTAYRAYLGRARRQPTELDTWADSLKTQRYWQVRGSILGLPEFAAAGTDAAS